MGTQQQCRVNYNLLYISLILDNSLSATTGAQWGVVTDAVYNSYTGAGYTVSSSNNFLGQLTVCITQLLTMMIH